MPDFCLSKDSALFFTSHSQGTKLCTAFRAGSKKKVTEAVAFVFLIMTSHWGPTNGILFKATFLPFLTKLTHNFLFGLGVY